MASAHLLFPTSLGPILLAFFALYPRVNRRRDVGFCYVLRADETRRLLAEPGADRRLELANTGGDEVVAQQPPRLTPDCPGLHVFRIVMQPVRLLQVSDIPRDYPVIPTVIGPLRSCRCAACSSRIVVVMLWLSSGATAGVGTREYMG